MSSTVRRPSRLRDLKYAAEQFDCSERTVRRMIAAGDLTGYRVGKRLLRIDADELDSILRRIPSAPGGAA